ncbi:hypothetical protein [Streptomyces sp. NPDC058268]|uniref:hypothetical protein n=1 Tax=Streptomyces sp. NPDC058268 TaxID=3346413 RepID=UPI0036EDF16A
MLGHEFWLGGGVVAGAGDWCRAKAQAGLDLAGEAVGPCGSSETGTATPDDRWRSIARTVPVSCATPLWDALEHGDDARAQEILQAFIQNEYINEGATHGIVDVELADLYCMDFTID